MAFKSTMLFDAMNNILATKSESIYKKHISDPNFKDFTVYMCLKYMTMCQDERIRSIVLEDYVILEKMEASVVYRWLMRKLPKLNSGFIRYIR